MTTERPQFGDWLQQQLNRAGLSVSGLAARIDVPAGTVSRWMNNRRVPETESCYRIADALSVAPEVVLYHADHLRELPRPLSSYEREREIRQLGDIVKRIEEVSHESLSAEVEVAYHGRVPADAVRWVAAGEGRDTRRVLSEYIGNRRPSDFLVVDASGDCLLTSYAHIASGDRVLLDRAVDRQPRNGEVVLIRVGEEYSLKLWYRQGDFIELRDGEGHLVGRLSLFDEFAVIGVFVARWTPASAEAGRM